jgi:cytidine deaminase
MSEGQIRALIEAAQCARSHAYAPYSHFCVGAALLCKDGTIYTGCNIENAAYTPTNCAERTAIFKAVSEGEREFTAIALVAGVSDGELQYTTPCGVCRQVMAEFTDPAEFQILSAKSVEDYKTYTLQQLFPESFGPEDLTEASSVLAGTYQ